MKPFTSIAIPHDDVAKGILTMDIFAADLWQVAKGTAKPEYQNPQLFFQKTYITRGLDHILDLAESRLKGMGGDAVIQLQTPFGGGKTHTLIALYHKSKKWNAKVVVLDGTALPGNTKLWEELERQLTGKVELTKGDTAPGKDALGKILSQNAPVLILIDELLEYITKASGIKVGDSNLGSQTLAFIQELTGAVATVGNALLVLTLPSSSLEHFDENAERSFHQLQKIVGRVEKAHSPVEDDEIESVIRKRLFKYIDKKEAEKVVDEFIEYALREGLLSKDEVQNYRERFLRSYPFKPEVIDVLYKRWGSFPTFQRTRGVLRILSIVIHDLINEKLPFIRLGDFNLDKEELRRELITHIGSEWDSIIAQDITSPNSGAKKVDESLPTSYKPYRLGTVISTTIFMTSFSGGGIRSISLKELKLYTAEPSFQSTIIDTALNELRRQLFYISDSDDDLRFQNQPNLNRIILLKEENVSEEQIIEEEKNILRKHISKNPKIKVYLYPKFYKDIPDNEELKLVILKKDKPDKDFLEKYGETPRIYRNTLIFLCVNEEDEEALYDYIRKLIALRSIKQDEKLQLSESQRMEVENMLKQQEQREYEEIRKYYRKLFLPNNKEDFKKLDMGIPNFGESKIDEEIYDYLRRQGEILEKISSKVIKNKYLGEKDFIETKKLYDALLKTPGELRVISKEGFIEGIKEGVEKGLFGFGYLEGEKPVCKKINEIPTVSLSEGEVIIKSELCKKEKTEKYQEEVLTYTSQNIDITTQTELKQGVGVLQVQTVEEQNKRNELKLVKNEVKLHVRIQHGEGKLSNLTRILNLLKGNFNSVELEIIIKAHDGTISKVDYDNILEALKQTGIEFQEEQ
ncbi:MAG: AAA family ATPase [Fervidicoccus fontis]|nr:MAG: AAA family ATPase [Fervidicoccus fontis]